MGHPLFDLLRKLEKHFNPAAFTLSRERPESVMITLTLVGERLEIDVFEDGHIEYSRFIGNEDVLDDLDVLNRLITEGE
jgi:hypothetical protein